LLAVRSFLIPQGKGFVNIAGAPAKRQTPAGTGIAAFHFVHLAHGHCPARALEPPELMMVIEAGLFDRGQVSEAFSA
jgi:hypothetical protein